MKKFKFTKAENVEEQVSSWLYKVRTSEKEPVKFPGKLGYNTF